ncbi:CehA/McbA family metallohydrolase [Aquimarina muelleri]|uniref:Secretion system C-terminal sorting domain-containing protein n=1 Tax=Aquimarina muelleri TaxID=279356 RepID=A0A918N5L4_9FLAO|nr:CehA/McbA family metallohydrolase [Aquimarina muelleri]MCX2763810.1 CehA/McbA family metallohydrolase [Aquimarina muelleri]GGX31248.1 hypothetical protein GCM10007384_35390 [Aquimarina muelleri]
MKSTITLILMLLFAGSFFAQKHPSTGEWNVYYGHLHNHTGLSDGKGTPTEAYTHARNVAGLDFMGLSEHGILLTADRWNTLKNSANANNVNSEFVTFWGFEWTSSLVYGHISIINTEDFTNVLSDFSFSDITSWLEKREGIAFFNHPGRENDISLEFEHFETVPTDKFVGMELWNKGTGFDKFYYNDGYFKEDQNRSFYDEAISRGWKIGAAGSHDHHQREWGETDMATAILAKSLTRDDLYESLKAKRFFSTEDRSIALSFTLDGNEMGSTVSGRSENKINIKAFDTENEIFTKAELYRNGILLFHWDVNVTNVDISYVITSSNNDSYYVKVTQEDGDEAISSPIFIEGNIGNTPPIVSLTSPEAGSLFSNGTTITLSANAKDTDGSISRVDFYNGVQKIGEVLSSPYRFTWANVGSGDYQLIVKAIDDQGMFGVSTPVNIKVSDSSSILSNLRVKDKNDDAEQGWTGIMYRKSSDLELVNDGFLNGNQKVGIRFKDVSIPKGAIINSAYVQFTTDETDRKSTDLVIKGELSANSTSFDSQNISKRDLTQAKMKWSVEKWDTVGETGNKQRTPELKDIVQEVINQPGWGISSALTFVITGKGRRTAESYDGSPSQAPLLVIDYSTVTSPPFELLKLPVLSPAKENLISLNDDHHHLEQKNADIDSQSVLYPNPFDDTIIVKVSDQDIAAIRIYNLQGQLVVYKKNINDSMHIINTSRLEKGTYVIAITTNKELITKKIIKE